MMGMKETLGLLEWDEEITINATKNSLQYVKGGQQMQEMRHLQSGFTDFLILPSFVGCCSLYTISFILQAVSVVIVSCVLVTKERRYKNIAHISWCTAATTLFMGILFTFFFTLVSLFSRDSCIILDHAENQKTTEGLPLLYPQELTPLLDSCLYSETKNAADNLKFGT